MTPELRRALLARAQRLESRLDLIKAEKESLTASESQARQIGQAIDNYNSMSRAPRRPDGRSSSDDDYTREMDAERAQRRAAAREAVDDERDESPSRRKGESVTEFQLRMAGMLPGDDGDDETDGGY